MIVLFDEYNYEIVNELFVVFNVILRYVCYYNNFYYEKYRIQNNVKKLKFRNLIETVLNLFLT